MSTSPTETFHSPKALQRRADSARLCALLALALMGIAAGCRNRPGHVDSDAAAHAAWHQSRIQSIGNTNGWSAVAGLHWLEEGAQTVGASETCAIRLPPGSAPRLVGTLVRQGNRVTFTAAPDVEVRLRGFPVTHHELKSDVGATPDELTLGRLTFWLLERGGRRALRVRDPEAPSRRAFQGIPVYPFDSRWQLPARFEPASPPREISVGDVTGATNMEKVAGTLVFKLGGRELRLEAMDDPEAGDLWVLFRDRTSDHTTYGSGRFLHVPKPKADGRTIIDFNRAYNPPCAFTAFATCPLPPRGNWLSVPIPAGERRPGPHP